MGLAELRSLILDAGSKCEVTIVTVEGEQFEIRPPTVRQRSTLVNQAANMKTKEVDTATLQVLSVIALTYVPGTEEKVFDEADRAVLEALPSGSFFDKLSSAAISMMKLSEEDPKEVGND